MDMNFGAELRELYESDKSKLRDIAVAMYNKYRSGMLVTPKEEEARRGRFARELSERFAEAGFVADVLWHWQTDETDEEGFPLAQSPTVSDNEEDNNLYYIPKVVITGRTATLIDYDHDQQAHEVKGGVFDGVKGVIDINTGLLKEDPKKKNIY